MYAKVADFFSQYIQAEVDDEQATHKLQLAAAALLVEVARADHHLSSDEMGKITAILKRNFDISHQELQQLVELAESKSEHAVELHPFTRLINDNYTREQKFELIKMMWQVAYADGQLDKYEDYIIRRLADLLHLSHREFIQAKHMVADRLGL